MIEDGWKYHLSLFKFSGKYRRVLFLLLGICGLFLAPVSLKTWATEESTSSATPLDISVSSASPSLSPTPISTSTPELSPSPTPSLATSPGNAIYDLDKDNLISEADLSIARSKLTDDCKAPCDFDFTGDGMVSEEDAEVIQGYLGQIMAMSDNIQTLESVSYQYVPDELIVEFTPDVKSERKAQIYKENSLKRIRGIPRVNLNLIGFRNQNLEALSENLKKYPEIKNLDKNHLVQGLYVPNDPRYPEQWNLPMIKMPEAWDITKGSATVKIAIIDSGADDTINELRTKVVNGVNLLDSSRPNDYMDDTTVGHGTAVAGIAGAATDNWGGIAGVGFNTDLLIIKACYPSPGSMLCSELVLTDGVYWAIDHGAKVINMSIGGPNPLPTLKQAIDTAVASGITVVAAAGNDNSPQVSYPARYDNAIVVGAVTADQRRWFNSNYGPVIDVMSPTNVLTLIQGEGNPPQYFGGTSAAAPHVSGVAALLYAIHPGWTPAQIETRIKQSADDIDPYNPGYEEQLGSGLLNTYSALSGGIGFRCFDVPVPVNPDPVPNGARNRAVNISDVIATLAYVGTQENKPATSKGYDYDSDKDGNGVKDGRNYDLYPAVPDGAINISDVLAILNHVGQTCPNNPPVAPLAPINLKTVDGCYGQAAWVTFSWVPAVDNTVLWIDITTQDDTNWTRYHHKQLSRADSSFSWSAANPMDDGFYPQDLTTYKWRLWYGLQDTWVYGPDVTTDSCSQPPQVCSGNFADNKFNICFFNGTEFNTFLGESQSDGASSVGDGTWIINRDWSSNTVLPEISSGHYDNVSAVWRGRLNFNPGTYKFHIIHDDGVQMWVDDVRRANWWGTANHGINDTDEFYLNAGYHKIEVRWQEGGGLANLKIQAQHGSCTNTFATNGFNACLYKKSDMTFLGETYDDGFYVVEPVDFNNWILSWDWGGGEIWVGDLHTGRTDDIQGIWRGRLKFAKGVYRFWANSDDGIIIEVDGLTKMNEWRDQHIDGFKSQFFTFQDEGWHDVKIYWYEGGGLANMQVKIEGCPVRDGEFAGCFWDGANFEGQRIGMGNTLIQGERHVDWQGCVVEDTSDPTWNPIRHLWGTGQVDGTNKWDNVSAIWIGNFNFCSSAWYAWAFATDDGFRFYDNSDSPARDEWGHTNYLNFDRYLSAGRHTFRVDWQEGGGNANIVTYWKKK